jgi:hypothetical protein
MSDTTQLSNSVSISAYRKSAKFYDDQRTITGATIGELMKNQLKASYLMIDAALEAASVEGQGLADDSISWWAGADSHNLFKLDGPDGLERSGGSQTVKNKADLIRWAVLEYNHALIGVMKTLRTEVTMNQLLDEMYDQLGADFFSDDADKVSQSVRLFDADGVDLLVEKSRQNGKLDAIIQKNLASWELETAKL